VRTHLRLGDVDLGPRVVAAGDVQIDGPVARRVRSVDLEVVAAEDVVVKDVHAQAVLRGEVGEERFPTRVAAVEVLSQKSGTEDLQKRTSGRHERQEEGRERQAHLVKVVLVPARLLQVHLEHLVPGVGRSLRATDPHPACRQGASAREPDRASAKGRAGRTGVQVVPAVVLLRDEVVRRHERLHVRVRVATKGDVRVDEEEVAVREDLDEGCEGSRQESARGRGEGARELADDAPASLGQVETL